MKTIRLSSRPRASRVVLLLLLAALVLGWRMWLHGALSVTEQRPRTLIIIQGQYRTLDLTVDSIVTNIVLPNRPCDVALSLDARDGDVSALVKAKLAPFLVASYLSEPGDARGQLALIEFQVPGVGFVARPR